tara:strand:- start:6125 stop:6298 length:174 start_codon:yes stop_codon:yes gene_type:complete
MTYSELQSIYKVSRQTLYRWKKLGVNLNSPQQITMHIASQNASSPAAVTAALNILKP